MISSKTIPLAIALVFGTIAAVGFSKMMEAQSQVEELIEIYVAGRTINPAEELTPEALKLERWPADRVPDDIFVDWETLQGKFASQRIFEGEPIVARKLMDERADVTTKIPKGSTVVAFSPEGATSVAALLSPGDRVDVMGFFKKSDFIEEPSTQIVLEGIRVWAIDGKTSRPDPSAEVSPSSTPKTISLLIHKEDSEAWTWANEIGSLRLNVGRPDDGASSEMENAPNPAGQAFLKWLKGQQESKEKKLSPPDTANLATSPAAAQPSVPSSPNIEPSAIIHEMTKIGSDGKVTIYRWGEGNPIPWVVSDKSQEDSKLEAGQVPKPVSTGTNP